MNKSILIVIVLIALGVCAYLFFGTVPNDTVGEPQNTESATYRSSEFGLEFDYREGPDGYTVEERIPTEIMDDFVRAIIVSRSEDVGNAPEGGEGAPTITIAIFTNTNKQWPQVWADAHTAYSNINLKMGEVSEAVVGGANAIRYMADGLYASDTVVVAHGDYVYVISGMFMDQDSDIRRDFQPLLDSIRFIPTEGQE